MPLDANRPSRAMTWGIHAFIAGTLNHAVWRLGDRIED